MEERPTGLSQVGRPTVTELVEELRTTTNNFSMVSVQECVWCRDLESTGLLIFMGCFMGSILRTGEVV